MGLKSIANGSSLFLRTIFSNVQKDDWASISKAMEVVLHGMEKRLHSGGVVFLVLPCSSSPSSTTCKMT